jgi:threonine dehydratase
MSSVTLDDIRRAAADFDRSFVRPTPVLRSSTLSAMMGGDVWLKAECLQRTGSFKIRGGWNRVRALSGDERARGIIAASAGNHAQGVALAARAHGIRATIVMPLATPLAKVEATRDYGAEVVLHGASYDEAQAEAERIGGERGLVSIPAFDDPLVVAGQGTIGLELHAELPEIDAVVVPVGGGGLIAGVAVAMKALRPGARIIGVQAKAAPGVRRSLEAGAAVHVSPSPTIAEAVAVGGPGDVTWPLIRELVDDVVLVDEDSIARAMVLLIERSKLVVEGGGAVGVAALLGNKIARKSGQRAAVLLSGGNVDINMLARVVEHGLMHEGRYFSLTVGLDDKPGQLAALSEIISAAGANILSVDHRRFGIDLPVGRVHVALLLEVRNREHATEVARALEAAGFARQEAGMPEFAPRSWGA